MDDYMGLFIFICNLFYWNLLFFNLRMRSYEVGLLFFILVL